MTSGYPRRIRVLVAEDSRFMRQVIRKILDSDPEIDAAVEEAVEAVASLAPDLVTMDVKMLRLDGLSAVERIMERRPTPILMLSSYTHEGSVAAIRALEREVMLACVGELVAERARKERHAS